jgi:hypothetical protein
MGSYQYQFITKATSKANQATLQFGRRESLISRWWHDAVYALHVRFHVAFVGEAVSADGALEAMRL